jgi:hypothetical protein
MFIIIPNNSYMFLLVLLFWSSVYMIRAANQPIKVSTGLYFPGRGCGGSSEIKYLSKIPEDTLDLECTFILDKTLGLPQGMLTHFREIAFKKSLR